MKNSFPPTMIVIFLIIFTNVVQAQTISTKLDKVELMKQFIGFWKFEGEFRTSDMIVETTSINIKSIRTDTYTLKIKYRSLKF
jgi:hypothetical protein